MCFLARAAPSGESLRRDRRPGVVDWSGGVFASCMPRVQLYVNACNGWPQFALQHHWLMPINCHFLRLYSAAGRGTAAVSSAIEESDLYLFHYASQLAKYISVRRRAIDRSQQLPASQRLWRAFSLTSSTAVDRGSSIVDGAACLPITAPPIRLDELSFIEKGVAAAGISTDDLDLQQATLFGRR